MDAESFRAFLFKTWHLVLSDEQVRQFVTYLELLKKRNEQFNLTSITTDGGIWRRHFIDSLSLLGQMDLDGLFVADAGSGAGLPGLAIAIVSPTTHVDLIEAHLKKCQFLSEVITALHLRNVTVIQGRLETLTYLKGSYDVIMCRALAPLDILLELTSHLLRVGGQLIAWKGPKPEEESKKASKAAKILGLASPKIIHYELPDASGNHTLLIYQKKDEGKRSGPRPYALIRRKPLA